MGQQQLCGGGLHRPACHGSGGRGWTSPTASHLTQHIGPTTSAQLVATRARRSTLTHRIGALCVTLVLLLLAWRLQRGGLVWPTALMLLGLSLQIGLGRISNVLLHLPLPVAVAHNGGGALLLLSHTVLVNYRLRAFGQRAPAPSPQRVRHHAAGLGSRLKAA